MGPHHRHLSVIFVDSERMEGHRSRRVLQDGNDRPGPDHDVAPVRIPDLLVDRVGLAEPLARHALAHSVLLRDQQQNDHQQCDQHGDLNRYEDLPGLVLQLSRESARLVRP